MANLRKTDIRCVPAIASTRYQPITDWRRFLRFCLRLPHGPEDPVAVAGPHARFALSIEPLHPAIVDQVLTPTIQQKAAIRPAVGQGSLVEWVIRKCTQVAGLDEFSKPVRILPLVILVGQDRCRNDDGGFVRLESPNLLVYPPICRGKEACCQTVYPFLRLTRASSPFHRAV